MTILLSPASYQFTEFHDLLLPQLPGCTVAMLNLNLREVIRDFCVRTGAWNQALTAVDTVASQAAYALTVPADSEIVRLTKLTVNDVFLWRYKDDADPGNTTEDEPEYVSEEPPFTMSLDLATITLATDEIPTAAVTGGLVVEGALKPTMSPATLPAFLVQEYGETLRYGVLSRLMRMGKKPWSDRELAVDYEARWNSGLNFAAYRAQTGSTRKRLRVKKYG